MSTEVILAVGFDAAANQVMRVKLMNAAKQGQKWFSSIRPDWSRII